VRKPIIAGNWKMNKSVGGAIDLAAEVKSRTVDYEPAEVVLCPPFTALKSVGDLVRYSSVKLGAQDVHWEADGAFTGEISVSMLKDLACNYVIVGHSERRTLFGETDESVRRKVEAVLAGGIAPIVCVGETLEERDAGNAESIVEGQIREGLRGLGDELARCVIAYEPVWAIGTGKTATAREAQAAHSFIRGLIGELAGETVAQAIRIQYGGSMKPANAGELLGQPDIDGGLIGGASLDAESFMQIVLAAE